MADIESANIVGYAEKATPAGFVFYSPQFANVNGNAIDIQDIKLDADTATGFTDNIQVLEEVSGAVIGTYYWASANDSGCEADGWLDESFALASLEIKKGTCVCVETAAESKLTSAGEVAKDGTEFAAGAGFSFLGNNTPVSMDIQDIKLDSALGTGFTDNIQVLEEGSGAVIATYYWASAADSGCEEDGWLDESFALATLEIKPGEGFCVEVTNDMTITIPSAL